MVAAYGTAYELENTNIIPNLKWDMLLDLHLVHQVEVVLDKQENFCGCVCQMMNIENLLVWY